MASQEEAVAPVEEEEVKKVESGPEFSVNGAPIDSFNSRISTDVGPGDVDMAESQVAVAGSVDSAAEAPVSAGAEPSASVDTGSASSGDVVDATEKVESWDLSEAVQESGANKEESKPIFSEDGTLADIKSQASSDLIADAPTSAASAEDSGGGVSLFVPSADVEEKTVEVSSEDAGVVSEELPAEVAVSEDVNPKFQDEGSAEKGDSEARESPVEEGHDIGEATSSAELDKEVAGVEAVPSPSADVVKKSVDVEDKPVDVEDKPVDVEDKPVDVEDKPVDVEDKPVDVEDKPADVEDKSVDVAEKSVEVNSEDAGVLSKELPAQDAAIEEVSPEILDEGRAEKGDSEVSEPPAELVNEIADATTGVEPVEAVASLEAVPSPSADFEEKSVDVEDKSVDVEEKPVHIEDKPIDVADKSVDIEDKTVEVNSEDAGIVSEELPAEVATSEEVSPKIPDEASDEKGDNEAPEVPDEGIQEVAEAATSAEPDEEVASLEAGPSPSVDLEEKSVELDSEDAEAVTEDVSPKIESEESAETGANEAPEAPVEDEVREVGEATTSVEPAEKAASVEAVPSPSDEVEEKSLEVHSEDAGGGSEDVRPKIEDEESAAKGASEAPEAPVEEEVHDMAEATASVEPDEAVPTLEAVPSPSVDVEEKSFEVHSEDAGAGSEDVSPNVEAEESAERGASEAPEAPVEEEVHDVAEAAASAEPDEAVSTLEAVPSPSVDVEEKSFEVHSEDAGTVSEDVRPKIEDEESAETGASEAPEAPEEGGQEVAEATEPDEEVASLEAVPSPSIDLEEKSVELGSEDAGAVSEDVSPKVESEESAGTGASEAPEAPVEEEVHEVAEATTSVEPDEEVASLEAVPSPSVDVEGKSVEVHSEDAGAVSEDASPKIEEGSAEKGDSEAPEAPEDEVHEVAQATTSVEPDEEVASLEAVPSPSVDLEEKSVELGSEDAGAVSGDVSPKVEAEESAETGASEAPEAPVEEEVHDIAEAATSTEPDEAVPTLEAVPSLSDDVEEKSFEVHSEDAGAGSEDVSPKVEAEESAETGASEAPEAPVEEEVHEVAQATTSVEPDEGVPSLEAVPSPSVDVEEKSFEVHSEDAGAGSEDVGPNVEAEESAERGASEAPEAPVEEDVHDVAEAAASAEPDEAVSTLEAVPSPSVDVEEKSFEVHSEDAGTVSEDVRPKIEDEESAERGASEAPEAPVEEVHEVAEATNSVESAEEVASLEAVPPPSVDVEGKSVEVHSEDAGAVSEDASPKIEEGSAESEAPEAPEEEALEVAEATTSAELAEAGASLEALSSRSVDVEEKAIEVDHLDPTTSAEVPEETASLESAPAPAPAEDSEDKFVQEVDSKDTSEASDVLPSESADRDDISPEPPAEGAADNVGSETLFVPDEEVHEVVEATISAEPGEVPVEPESALAPSDVVDEKSVDVSPADAIGVITASEGVDQEGVSPEPLSEATISAGTDTSLESGAVEGSASLESGVDEGPASLESVSSPATNVEDRSLEVDPEDTSELPPESADKEDLSPELPAEGSADNVGSEALFTPAEEVHEVVEAMIAPEPDEGSTSPESGPAPDDVEEKPEDLSEATTTELPQESVDKEVVSRDLPVEEVHAPIGKTEDAAADAESAAASSEDVQTTSESTSREFNFNDLKEALTTSDDVISEEVATVTGEEGSSSDAVASDATPLEISSPPPAVENKEAPKSYDLHEVAGHLEDAAEKTLEDVKSSVVGDRQASVAESVAQIVLDESSKTGDSSELISGVIQHVAQLAQDDFQSDPNVLPDTVNQVFDRDMAGSPANEASHPKETTSLGTKFSLFVVWCISLCASHVSSKDMPAPALKLGAEEVAAVLHSNAQGAASSKAASSV